MGFAWTCSCAGKGLAERRVKGRLLTQPPESDESLASARRSLSLNRIRVSGRARIQILRFQQGSDRNLASEYKQAPPKRPRI